MTHTLTQRHYWDDGELWSECRIQQPGPAADAREHRIKRLRDAGTKHTTTGGVVTVHAHYPADHGEPAFDVRVELEWIDDGQPDLFSEAS